jgi:uncharacterized membrane-anchored protein
VTYWVQTILAVTLGTTVADFLSVHLGLGPGLGLKLGVGLGMSATIANMSLVVVGTLIVQISTGRHIPGLYWLTVVLVSVLGTLVSDDLVDSLGVSLGVSPWAATAVFGGLFGIVLIGLHRSEHTLSGRSVLSRRGEVWHWLAVFCACSLGAAMSDLISAVLMAGYATTVLVAGAVMVVTMLAPHSLRLNAVAAFWAAYVVALPLGESLGDVLTASPRDGGLGLGTIGSSLTVLLVLVVVGLVRARHRRNPHRRGRLTT